MNDKNRARLLEHQIILDQTLQKQLVRSLAFNVRDSYAEIARITNPANEMKRMYTEIARITNPANEMKRMYAEIARITNPANEMKRMYAEIAKIVKPYQDWQKQLNLLKATQERLGFPNIIRGGLSIDSFPPLGPGRSYAPSPVPPTAVTDEVYEEISPEIIPAPSPELVPITNHKSVFIVHGHDHETRDDVSKFVSNWGLTATILDKQANKGRTIIEKFEDCADEASFAIVLLTPDDVGASVNDKAHLKYRARQNVIYEWGYFSGSIGREQVCILYKGNLELPSDTQGVVYVRMDDNGEWKQSIVREMESVGLLIDANKI